MSSFPCQTCLKNHVEKRLFLPAIPKNTALLIGIPMKKVTSYFPIKHQVKAPRIKTSNDKPPRMMNYVLWFQKPGLIVDLSIRV